MFISPKKGGLAIEKAGEMAVITLAACHCTDDEGQQIPEQKMIQKRYVEVHAFVKPMVNVLVYDGCSRISICIMHTNTPNNLQRMNQSYCRNHEDLLRRCPT